MRTWELFTEAKKRQLALGALTTAFQGLTELAEDPGLAGGGSKTSDATHASETLEQGGQK